MVIRQEVSKGTVNEVKVIEVMAKKRGTKSKSTTDDKCHGKTLLQRRAGIGSMTDLWNQCVYLLLQL